MIIMKNKEIFVDYMNALFIINICTTFYEYFN